MLCDTRQQGAKSKAKRERTSGTARGGAVDAMRGQQGRGGEQRRRRRPGRRNLWWEAVLLRRLSERPSATARELQDAAFEWVMRWDERWRVAHPGESPGREAEAVLRRLEWGGWTDRQMQHYARQLRPVAVALHHVRRGRHDPATCRLCALVAALEAVQRPAVAGEGGGAPATASGAGPARPPLPPLPPLPPPSPWRGRRRRWRSWRPCRWRAEAGVSR